MTDMTRAAVSRRHFLQLAGAGMLTLTGAALTGCGNSTSGEGSDKGSKLAAIKSRGHLNAGVKKDVPGYGYYDTAKGRFEGMEVDLCYQIAAAVFGVSYKEARAQELVEFTDVTPKTRGPLIDNGQLDVVAATYTITDERKQSVDFSDAYAMAQLAILANADSGVASIDDLNQPGKKVAVKTGSTGDVYATKNLTNAEIVRLADESACVTEVVQGKADGFLYDQLTIYRNHEANPDTTEAVFIPFQDAEEWGIAVKKGNTELLDQLNAFIAQSKTDGEFDRLTEKYLADEKKAFDQYGFKWFFDFE